MVAVTSPQSSSSTSARLEETVAMACTEKVGPGEVSVMGQILSHPAPAQRNFSPTPSTTTTKDISSCNFDRSNEDAQTRRHTKRSNHADGAQPQGAHEMRSRFTRDNEQHEHGERGERGRWDEVRAARSFRRPERAGTGGPRMRGRGRGGPGRQARRGDVRAAILALLAERPMHGYEMIKELGGTNRRGLAPQPGSGLSRTPGRCEDQGMVEADAAEGKQLFSLTDTGREEAAKAERPQAVGRSRPARHQQIQFSCWDAARPDRGRDPPGGRGRHRGPADVGGGDPRRGAPGASDAHPRRGVTGAAAPTDATDAASDPTPAD